MNNNSRDYGRQPKQVLSKYGSKSTLFKEKIKGSLGFYPHSDWRGNPYILAMLKDIYEAGTPQELLKLLHDKALNPPQYGPLSETQEAVLICSVGSKLWNMSGKFLRDLDLAVELILFPSLGWSKRSSSEQAQILNYKQLEDWPGALLGLYNWVACHWSQKSLFDVTKKSGEMNYEAYGLGVISNNHQALYNDFPGKTNTLRGIEPEIYKKDPEGYRNRKEYKELEDFRKKIEEASDVCAKAQRVYDARFKDFRESPVASRGEPSSSTEQAMPQATVKTPPRSPSTHSNNYGRPPIKSNRINKNSHIARDPLPRQASGPSLRSASSYARMGQ